jgi:hypothetical protein
MLDQPDEDVSGPRAALDSLIEDLVLKPFLPLVEEARQLKVSGLASFVADMASAIDNSEPDEMAKAYDDLAKAVAETKAREALDFVAGGRGLRRPQSILHQRIRQNAIVAAGMVTRRPARLSHLGAAALPVVGVTAWQMLAHASAREG